MKEKRDKHTKIHIATEKVQTHCTYTYSMYTNGTQSILHTYCMYIVTNSVHLTWLKQIGSLKFTATVSKSLASTQVGYEGMYYVLV